MCSKDAYKYHARKIREHATGALRDSAHRVPMSAVGAHCKTKTRIFDEDVRADLMEQVRNFCPTHISTEGFKKVCSCFFLMHVIDVNTWGSMLVSNDIALNNI